MPTYRSIEVNGAGGATAALLAPSVAVSDEDTLDADGGALVMVESGESSLSSGQLNDSFNFVYTFTESTIVTPAGSTLGPTESCHTNRCFSAHNNHTACQIKQHSFVANAYLYYTMNLNTTKRIGRYNLIGYRNGKKVTSTG